MKKETILSLLVYAIPALAFLVLQLWLLPKPSFAGSSFNWFLAVGVISGLESWLCNVFVFPFLFGKKK